MEERIAYEYKGETRDNAIKRIADTMPRGIATRFLAHIEQKDAARSQVVALEMRQQQLELEASL